MLGLSNGFLFVLFAVNAYRYVDLLETQFTLFIFSVLFSIFHIQFIALDRLLAVSRPIRHKVFSIRKKAYLSSGFLLILAIAKSALLQIVNELTTTFKVSCSEQMQSQSLQKLQQKSSNINGFSEAKIGSTLSPLLTQISNSNYSSDVEYTLSVVIMAVDVLIFSFYCSIIHHATSSKKKASIKIKHKKLLTACLTIGVTFVQLTLPFVIAISGIYTILGKSHFDYKQLNEQRNVLL